MIYTNPDTIQEVANILDDFDETMLIDLFRQQIMEEESFITIPIDRFGPLLQSYQRATDLERKADEDDIAEIKQRFQNICTAIIEFIENKFSITVDTDWIESQYGKLPAVTLALYHFFVLDTFYIILGAMNNYIAHNCEEVFNAFSGMDKRRDVTTITNMKTMDPRYAIIVSSLYDVTDYVFSMLDNEIFFDYISADYAPALAIKKLSDQGVIVGDFTRKFADIYKEDLELRSKVVLELAFKIRDRGYLRENATIIPASEIGLKDDYKVTPAQESNTDIESDVDD